MKTTKAETPAGEPDPPIGAEAYESAVRRARARVTIVTAVSDLPRDEQLATLADVYVAIDAQLGELAVVPSWAKRSPAARRAADGAPSFESLIFRALEGRAQPMLGKDLVAAVRLLDPRTRPSSIRATATVMARPGGALVRSGQWGAHAFALRQPSAPAGEAP